MAHTEQLARESLDSIATQVGLLAPNLIRDPDRLKKDAELAETFPVWLLHDDEILKDGRTDLSLLAHNTGRWHSQVRIDGKAVLFARSILLGPTLKDWQVKELFEGALAPAIEKAIDWVDRDANVGGDPLVRLLDVPAYNTHAFWLVREKAEDEIVVAYHPPGMTFLEKSKLYTATEFLTRIRKETLLVGVKE
jgi:hypothetical protein